MGIKITYNKKCCISIFFLILFLATMGTSFAQNSKEYAVKAAFVLNFARYTQWPNESFSKNTEPLELCVLGDKSIEPEFETIKMKKIGTRPLHIRFIGTSEDLGQCDLLFVSREIDNGDLQSTFAALKARPVLTVGESIDFIRHGGIINFLKKEGRFRFEVNPGRAQEKNLKISSRLLKLAIIVGEK